MEDREKRREKWKDMFLVGVWLDGGEEKNLVGFGCFLLSPPKCFLPTLERKHVRKCLDKKHPSTNVLDFLYCS